VQVVVEGRREREFAPTLKALAMVTESAKSDGTPPKIQARMEDTRATMQMFDDWYAQVSGLPRPVQQALLKLGGGIARLIPKGKSG
ncbi:ArsR family transcriptional regulator, partial [Escherichia coli]|nr:ArsR family transcriptional regulator [Escherichia coli]